MKNILRRKRLDLFFSPFGEVEPRQQHIELVQESRVHAEGLLLLAIRVFSHARTDILDVAPRAVHRAYHLVGIKLLPPGFAESLLVEIPKRLVRSGARVFLDAHPARNVVKLLNSHTRDLIARGGLCGFIEAVLAEFVVAFDYLAAQGS